MEKREIKFRAMCAATKKWVYGLPSTSTTLSNTITHIEQFFENRKFGRSNVFIKTETLGQFTGLLDKNGKEIYEGDILESMNKSNTIKRAPMIFNEEEGRYELKDQWGIFISDEGHRYSEYKIIGNIYENSNLLTKL